MATGARGEAYLECDGKHYAILFTNRALADAERATGKSVLQLARLSQVMELGVGDTAHMLHVGLEHARREARLGGRSYTINDAFRILDALGFGTVLAAIMEAVAAVLAYDGEEEGLERPPEE